MSDLIILQLIGPEFHLKSQRLKPLMQKNKSAKISDFLVLIFN